MTQTASPTRVLMVCMGNICRSPTAQGVLEHLLQQGGWQQHMAVDSAGTHSYHIGHAPDASSQQPAASSQQPAASSQQHAKARGYDLSSQRARQLQTQDFVDFDWILVMDADNERLAHERCPPQHRHKIHRLAAFCQTQTAHEVPDPYYGGADGFEIVLDLCEDACAGFLAFWQAQRLG